MIIILRLFYGYLIQTLPFAMLSIIPFISSPEHNYRWSRRTTLTATVIFVLTLSTIFSLLCYMLYLNHSESPALFDECNNIFMLMLLPCILYYFLVINTIWVQKLFIIAYSLTIGMTISSLCNIIKEYFEAGIHSDNLPYAVEYLLIITVMTAVILPVAYILFKKSYLSVSGHIEYKLHRKLAVFSIILFIVLVIHLSVLDYSKLPGSFDGLEMILYNILSIPLIYYFMFRILYYCFQSDQLDLILHHTVNQLKYRDEQYRNLQSNIETSKRFRHDLRHNIHIIQDHLISGNIDEAINYLNQYEKNINELSYKSFCKNATVNALLRYYEQRFISDNIVFYYKIKLPEVLPTIETTDLAVILGNLLDNAYDAAIAVHDANNIPHIYLTIILVNNSAVITLDNSFDGKIRHSNNHYLTTKEGHTGLGLISIEQIAAKYQGTASFTYDNAEFHSSVVMNI